MVASCAASTFIQPFLRWQRTASRHRATQNGFVPPAAHRTLLSHCPSLAASGPGVCDHASRSASAPRALHLALAEALWRGNRALHLALAPAFERSIPAPYRQSRNASSTFALHIPLARQWVRAASQPRAGGRAQHPASSRHCPAASRPRAGGLSRPRLTCWAPHPARGTATHCSTNGSAEGLPPAPTLVRCIRCCPGQAPGPCVMRLGTAPCSAASIFPLPSTALRRSVGVARRSAAHTTAARAGTT